MIEPVVHENSTKAAQKTPVMLSPRFGPAEPSHGRPYWSPQKNSPSSPAGLLPLGVPVNFRPSCMQK